MGELSSNASNSIGAQIGGTAVGATIGGLFSMANGAIQQKYNKENLALQHQYNEESANNADARTRSLYSDLYSPQAQLQQIKDAGLSPSLMYSGNTGTTGSSPSGAQSQGVGLPGVSMDLANAVMQGAQVASQLKLQNAQTENIKADTEGKEIANANDPIVQDYIVEKQQTIKDANEQEANLMNNAWTTFQNNLVNLGYHSEGLTFSKSHAEGQSESESSGYTMGVQNAHGDSNAFNVGGSTNVGVGLKGVSAGVSANYGQSKSHNESHGESHGENSSHSLATNIADAIMVSQNKSGNKTELVEIIDKFIKQTQDITRYTDRTRNMAIEIYEARVKHYEENREKQHRKKGK